MGGEVVLGACHSAGEGVMTELEVDIALGGNEESDLVAKAASWGEDRDRDRARGGLPSVAW